MVKLARMRQLIKQIPPMVFQLNRAEANATKITSSGTMIRVNAGDLSQYGRSAAGVIVMRLDEGSYVVNFAKVEKQDEDESGEEQA